MTDNFNLEREVVGLAKYLSDRKTAGLVDEKTMLQILYHTTARKAISVGQGWGTMRKDFKFANDMLREKNRS